jgi:hypothetical protein
MGFATERARDGQIFCEKSRPALDRPVSSGIFVIPLDAGLHQTRVRRSVFSQLLGLQIELNFVPA